MVKSGESARQESERRCLVEAELRARAAYADPGRHYHCEDHLDHCLAQLEAVSGLPEHERRLLRWALLWHDAVYDPRRDDNEEKSAVLAHRELTGCGAASADALEVARLIRLTKNHHVEYGDRLGALLVSIDLSILGSDPDRYRAYVEAVRHEYAHVPDTAWHAARAKVLESLLKADPIYPDPNYCSRLELQARRNIAAEISRLPSG